MCQNTCEDVRHVTQNVLLASLHMSHQRRGLWQGGGRHTGWGRTERLRGGLH